MFNIHKQTKSEEDKIILFGIIQKQNRTSIKNTFSITCGCCQKPTPIYWLYKCFYCGVWFCHKCAKEHFELEPKRCSGHKVFPDGTICKGCPDCKEN